MAAWSIDHNIILNMPPNIVVKQNLSKLSDNFLNTDLGVYFTHEQSVFFILSKDKPPLQRRCRSDSNQIRTLDRFTGTCCQLHFVCKWSDMALIVINECANLVEGDVADRHIISVCLAASSPLWFALGTVPNGQTQPLHQTNISFSLG